MTLTMADSIYPQNLPAGFDAYLGYVDGKWPTYNTVRQMFPGVPVIGLTVTGATLAADGCDIETGDLSAASGAAWLKAKLGQGAAQPIAYCSVDSMAAVVAELAALGVSREQVRLLSAHYGEGPHICGPSSCNLIDIPLDATQWTDAAAGNAGAQIDSSLLTDGFFQEDPMDPITILGLPGTWQSIDVQLEPATGAVIVVGTGTDGKVYSNRCLAPVWNATNVPLS